MYYDRKGNEISVEEWATLFEDSESRRVAETVMGGGVWVSTVHLGIDHNFSPDGPPLIFETMVFGGEHDQETWRYATEEEALAGHRQMVKNLETP